MMQRDTANGLVSVCGDNWWQIVGTPVMSALMRDWARAVVNNWTLIRRRVWRGSRASGPGNSCGGLIDVHVSHDDEFISTTNEKYVKMHKSSASQQCVWTGL